MNVEELIAELQKLDPTLRVVVRGYEEGVNTVGRVAQISIRLNANTEWDYGQHESHIIWVDPPDNLTQAYELVGEREKL